MSKITAQIKAIQKQIAAGKVKNIYAAQGKITSLIKAAREEETKNRWSEYMCR